MSTGIQELIVGQSIGDKRRSECCVSLAERIRKQASVAYPHKE